MFQWSRNRCLHQSCHCWPETAVLSMRMSQATSWSVCSTDTVAQSFHQSERTCGIPVALESRREHCSDLGDLSDLWSLLTTWSISDLTEGSIRWVHRTHSGRGLPLMQLDWDLSLSMVADRQRKSSLAGYRRLCCKPSTCPAAWRQRICTSLQGLLFNFQSQILSR